MKVQYFGDVNDFHKFALLRLLAQEGEFKIGVCWMMTEGDQRPDGNNRNYLKQPQKWRPLDPELFDELKKALLPPSLADLEQKVEKSGLIPGARFFNDTTPAARVARQNFHQACLSLFADADLAFFDPDNGLEIQSCPKGRKNSNKFVFGDELADHFAKMRSILVYQHYPHKPRALFMTEIALRLVNLLPQAVVYSFQTPHVAFMLAARSEHASRAHSAVEALASKWPASLFKAERHHPLQIGVASVAEAAAPALA